MIYDAAALLYEGGHVNGQFLQLVDLASFQVSTNLFGLIGPGKYTVNAMPEDMGNFIAGNRMDLYVYRDLLRSNYTHGAIQCPVRDSSRFEVGDTLLLYNESQFDIFGMVSSIDSANRILYTTSTAITGNYVAGDTIMVLRHRGRVSAVDSDDALTAIQSVETTSYFNDLNCFVVNENILSNDTVGFECAWVAYNVINTYAASGQLPDLVIEKANFYMTSAANGSPYTTSDGVTGTGVGYSGTNASTPMMTFLQDVVSQSNGGSDIDPPAQYSMGVNVNNVLSFYKINQGPTPTVSYTLNEYSDDGLGDGLFSDCCITHTEHDQDLANIYNVLIATGGNDALGNPLTVTIEDQNSVNIYGQREQFITNSNANTLLSLQNWAGGQLNQTAYPIQTYTTEIFPSRAWVTTLDFVSVSINRYLPDL